MRRAVLLDTPSHIAAVLKHHGYIQIDPINVCGRMHDLILRNRVRGYKEGDLMRFLHGHEELLVPTARTAFEHHVPGTNVLVAFSLDAWPHLISAMRQRSRTRGVWSGKLTSRERIFAEQIIGHMSARGPLSSEEFDDPRSGKRVWGSTTLAKSVLQKLFFHGRILISGRRGQRRKYDLPERVLPKDVLNASVPTSEETSRWLILLKLRQRRLVSLKASEVNSVHEFVQSVQICDPPAGAAGQTLFCLRADLPLLEESAAIQTKPTSSVEPLFVAPLDPLIYDRRLTSALWGFDYTWEVYTPPLKRVRGYYALPILDGLEIIGHIDAKADRKAGRLTVISKQLRKRRSIDSAVRLFAQWLGLNEVKF